MGNFVLANFYARGLLCLTLSLLVLSPFPHPFPSSVNVWNGLGPLAFCTRFPVAAFVEPRFLKTNKRSIEKNS